MYDRTPRPLTQPSGSTASGVGPGTYYSDKSRPRGSYAPFLSMAARESFLTVDEHLAGTPGPAHYSPAPHCSKAKGGRSLMNRAKRFTPPSSQTPGPGTYTVNRISDWIRKTYPPPSHNGDSGRVSGRVQFYRQETAPSIPVPGQNYGYDEDEGGTLQPQPLPPHDLSMGPAYYNVSNEETATTARYKGVHFGSLQSQRTQFKGREGPGPGDYHPVRDAPSPHIHSHKPSNLPRYHELVTRVEQKKAVPGPGQYEIHSQFDQRGRRGGEEGEEAESSAVPFGSTQQRFLDPKGGSPACTSYQDPRTALESVQRVTGMKRTPFGQTSARFRSDRQVQELPGPGAYNDSAVTGMAAQLSKKAVVLGVPRGAFGSGSVRTAPLVRKDERLLPGPAHYHQQGEGNPPPAKPRPSHTFASTSKRLYSPPSIAMTVPPPGSYEVCESFHHSQGKAELHRLSSRASTAFLSSADRFAPPRDVLLEQPDTFNPGPGAYAPESSQMLGKGRAGLLCCREQRFMPVRSTVPGPGAYELSRAQRDTLLQGTFNASLQNPLSGGQDRLEMTVKKQTFVLGV